MSKHSQLLGSFERTSNLPLEANYCFDTVDSLNAFYSDPVNKATLHKGLLKVVGNQDLYWAVEIDGELVFEKLISFDSIESLKEEIKTLQNSLENTNEEVDKIKEDVNFLYTRSKLLNVIVGVKPTEDIEDFLKTLPYSSIKEISNALEELFTLLEATREEIMGDVSDDYNSLEKIENKIKEFQSNHQRDIANLWIDLNNTKKGAGLNNNGDFIPSTNTTYIKDAESITEALNILDSKILESKQIELEGKNTGTVDIDIVKGVDKTTISAKVKAAPDSDIQVTENGLYHKVDSVYENGILTIKVNGNVRQQHVLGLSSIVEDGYYDSDSESVVIVFKLQNGDNQTVRIPVSSLIAEWIVDNSYANKVVELTKDRIEAGGADRLSADVRISSNKDNILEKDGNTLLVRGTADNISFGESNVQTKLEDLSNSVNSLEDSISDLSNKQSLTEQLIDSLSSKVDTEIQDRKDSISVLDSKISDEITNRQQTTQDLTTSLNQEIANRIKEDSDIKNLITESNANITSLQSKVDSLQSNLAVEIQDRKDSSQVLRDDLERECDKLEQQISTLAGNLNSALENASIKIDEVQNEQSAVRLEIGENGLFATLIWSEYE